MSASPSGVGGLQGFGIAPAAVPEPSSVACLTLLGCGAVYRRVRRKKVA
ncbi:PEP-CTERM sorting domain-containing protein [Crateriforma conspicua]